MLYNISQARNPLKRFSKFYELSTHLSGWVSDSNYTNQGLSENSFNDTINLKNEKAGVSN